MTYYGWVRPRGLRTDGEKRHLPYPWFHAVTADSEPQCEHRLMMHADGHTELWMGVEGTLPPGEFGTENGHG